MVHWLARPDHTHHPPPPTHVKFRGHSGTTLSNWEISVQSHHHPPASVTVDNLGKYYFLYKIFHPTFSVQYAVYRDQGPGTDNINKVKLQSPEILKHNINTDCLLFAEVH